MVSKVTEKTVRGGDGSEEYQLFVPKLWGLLITYLHILSLAQCDKAPPLLFPLQQHPAPTYQFLSFLQQFYYMFWPIYHFSSSKWGGTLCFFICIYSQTLVCAWHIGSLSNIWGIKEERERGAWEGASEEWETNWQSPSGQSTKLVIVLKDCLFPTSFLIEWKV